jgi:hypothetical protein
MADEDLLLSRGNERHIELRGMCPAMTVSVLDAVSLSKGQTRTELVNEILGDWAKAKVHEASLVSRVLQGNPLPAEAAGLVG